MLNGQDAFVLCRVFQKSGPGPKNGEQYGAPFVEEEWEEDEELTLPGEEIVANKGLVDDSEALHLEVDDIAQVCSCSDIMTFYLLLNLASFWMDFQFLNSCVASMKKIYHIPVTSKVTQDYLNQSSLTHC